MTHHVGNQGWESIDPDDPNLWAVWNCREAVYPGSVENWVSRGIYYKGEVVRFENQYCEVLTNSTAGWSTIEPTHYSMHSVWSCRNMSLEPQVSGWVSGQEYMKGEQVDYNGKRCQMSYWSNSGWEHLPPDSPVLWAVWKCED